MGKSVMCAPFSDATSSTKKSKDRCPVISLSLLLTNSSVKRSMARQRVDSEGKAS